MKKHILIIGNNEGLPGVKIDIENYNQFFMSPFGGNWFPNEINVKLNPTKSELSAELNRLKGMSLDYLIVIFSGHGGQERETILELNPRGETIGESDLKYLATRQLNIFDCCRCYPMSLNESALFKVLSKAFTGINTREKFEKRILQAVPQQVDLYSCSINEISNDTSDGGVYSKYLIQSAKNIVDNFKLIGNAHQEAFDLTMGYNLGLPIDKQQHPEAVLPRCLSSQQLIISVKPN